ncbi:MAG: stage III sporulation AC/AD family protein [Clostridia bacterium]|nr:stage III sporulation AC/AD family protein [Clostridia bacterium]
MIWRVVLSALVMVLVGAILSEVGFSSRRLYSALCLTLLLLSVLGAVGDMLGEVLGFADGAGVGEVARCAVKIVGVGYVTGFVCDVCEELGERGISSAVMTVGRVEMLLIVFPYFKEILNVGMGLLK